LTSLTEEIAGFFIVETHVLNTTGNFRSEQEVEDLWDSLLARLCLAIDNALKAESEPDVFLRVKEILIAFIMTMEVGLSYSHFSAPLLTRTPVSSLMSIQARVCILSYSFFSRNTPLYWRNSSAPGSRMSVPFPITP
jgi:hypothetical protein